MPAAKGVVVSKAGQNRKLLAEFQSWIDNCLVPILLKQYLADLDCQSQLATGAESVAHSDNQARSSLGAERWVSGAALTPATQQTSNALSPLTTSLTP